MPADQQEIQWDLSNQEYTTEKKLYYMDVLIGEVLYGCWEGSMWMS